MDHKTLLNKVFNSLEISEEEAREFLDLFIDAMVDVTSEGDTIAIPGFGNFEPRKRMERIAQHPSTGKRILIPPKIVLGFKPSAVLKNRINQKSEENE